MKKFVITVFIGYAMVILFLVVTTQRTGKGRGNSKDGGGEGEDGFSRAGGRGKATSSVNGVDQKISSRYYFPKLSDAQTSKPSDSAGLSQKTFYAGGALSSEWAGGANTAQKAIRLLYENGKPWMELTLERDLPEGVVKFYYPGGALWGSASYHEGLLEGETRIFYENGSPWIEITFEGGAMKGPLKAYSEGAAVSKGTILSESEKEKVRGYFKAYDEKGELKYQWDYTGDDAANRIVTKYDNGEISSSWELKDGKLNGVARLYHKKGMLWAELGFKEGIKEGLVQTYYEDGALWTRANFVAGKLIGVLEINYPKGLKWVLFDSLPGMERTRFKVFSEKAVAGSPNPNVPPVPDSSS